MSSDQKKRPLLFQYFEDSANILLAEFTRSSQQDSADNLGTNRESFCNNFLTKILPLNLSIGSGEIWDSIGNRTGQLDLILVRNDAPRLTFGERETYLSEGVYAVIEIKSNLTREKLKEAGNQLMKVKNLHLEKSTSITYGPTINRPLRIIFSYKGARWNTLMDEIAKQKWLDLFDLICILNKGLMIKTGLLLRFDRDDEFPYMSIKGKAASLGILYLYLITYICSFMARSPSFIKYFEPIDQWKSE